MRTRAQGDGILVGPNGSSPDRQPLTTGCSGTPAYMSPEVARNEPATPVSDIFALGSTVYAAVFGSPPFGADGNPLMIMRRVERCDVEIPSGAGPLGSVLATLLARDPADRPTATQAAALLRAAAGDASFPPEAAAPGRSRWPLAMAGGVALVAAAVIAGGVTGDETTGAPATDPATLTQPPTPPTVAGLGTASTADPCALTDQAALREFGGPTLDADYSGFAGCDVIVEPTPGDKIDVHVELAHADGPRLGRLVEDVGDGMLLTPSAQDSQACSRDILLPDDNQVEVTAQFGGGPIERCAMVDIAVQSAITVLRRGEVPRRTGPFPPSSLAQLDACALPSAAALAQVPGIDPADPQPGFGRWECAWGGEPFFASVRFDRNPPYSAPQDGEMISLGGRTAFVERSDDTTPLGYCIVKVAHRMYVDDRGVRKTESVLVEVDGRVPSEQLCGFAEDLAAPVAAALPTL